VKFVSRADLGWGPSPAADQGPNRGVKVHYLGEHVDPQTVIDHRNCLDLWRRIRDSHLANTAEGYVDVAYNAAACQHGYVLEGRGPGKRTGANGNRPLNEGHDSVVALIGDSGVTEPTSDLLHGLCDAIAWLQEHGAGPEVKGHRDGYATSCPGGPLYAWVQGGAQRPGTPAPQPPQEEQPVMAAPRFPGRLMAVQSPMLHGDDVRDWQKQMRTRGWSIDVDGWYGPASAKICDQFQRDSSDHGWNLDVDGIVGPATWDAAFRRPVS
jgi:hypothetical protein